MKKLVFCLVALGVIVSCAKEKDFANHPVSGKGTEIKIKAFVEEGTKTAYADHKTFSWLAGDIINVEISNGSTSDFSLFQTSDAGASAEFTGTVGDDYRPSGVAVYPHYLNPVVSGGSVSVSLPQRFFYNRGGEDTPINGTLAYVGDSSPMKNLALVGSLQQDGSYKFQSAQGIIHLTFYNVADDAGATFMILNSNEEVWGTFAVEDATIKMSNYVSGGSQMSYAVVTPANGKVDLYWPLPVGTLTSGAEFQLCDASQSVIYSVTTKKDIVIERNKITELSPVNARRNVYDLFQDGEFLSISDFRRRMYKYRMSGELTNMMYSMDNSVAEFLPHQFIPVVKFLESYTDRLLIADEVGLGKTIEAMYIWEELKARKNAKRLLVVVPAVLRDKWRGDMRKFFGIDAHIVSAQGNGVARSLLSCIRQPAI